MVAMQKAETHVGKVKKEDQVKGPKSYQRSVLEHLTSRKKIVEYPEKIR